MMANDDVGRAKCDEEKVFQLLSSIKIKFKRFLSSNFESWNCSFSPFTLVNVSFFHSIVSWIERECIIRQSEWTHFSISFRFIPFFVSPLCPPKFVLKHIELLMVISVVFRKKRSENPRNLFRFTHRDVNLMEH